MDQTMELLARSPILGDVVEDLMEGVDETMGELMPLRKLAGFKIVIELQLLEDGQGYTSDFTVSRTP